MARVLIATQAWGVVQNHSGDVLSGLPVEMDDLNGDPAEVFTTEGGSTPETLTTTSRGEIPGWVEGGSYDLTVRGVTRRVEATNGGSLVDPTEFSGGQPAVWDPSAEKLVGDAGPFSGRKWAALGTSVTLYDVYTAGLEVMLDAPLTNLGVGTATLSSAAGGNGLLYGELTSIPTDAALVTIEAGLNDFRLNVALGTIADTARATSFFGALYETCSWLRTNRPNAVVYFLTPYGNGAADSSVTGKWNVANTNGATFAQFRQAIRDVCAAHSYPVIDVGESAGVGSLATTSMTDGIHPTPLGGYRMAHYLRAALLRRPFDVDPIGEYTDLSLFIDATKCTASRLAVDEFGTLLAGMGRPASSTYAGAIFKTAVRKVEYTAAMRTNGGANWAVVAANATHAAAVGEDGINTMWRFTRDSASFDNNVNVTKTGTMLRSVKLEVVAGKVRYSTASAKGGTFTQNYPDLPTAGTEANAALKAITDGGVQLGILPAYAHAQPYALGYDVYVNDAPILDVLKAGVLPA